MFGSAVHVPSRVQIKIPKQQPWSATAAPFADWGENQNFPLAEVLDAWGISERKPKEDAEDEPNV